MKITMYELIGLIKDDKAPNKVKYKNKIYSYHKGYDFNYIYNSSTGCLLKKEDSLFTFSSYKHKDDNQYWDENSTIDFLNSEVEIISEEKKIPEKIKDKYCSQISKVELAQKYNEIIDYLKSKGDE